MSRGKGGRGFRRPFTLLCFLSIEELSWEIGGSLGVRAEGKGREWGSERVLVVGWQPLLDEEVSEATIHSRRRGGAAGDGSLLLVATQTKFSFPAFDE